MVRCVRDTRCLKEKGHKGWCKVTGEREWEESPRRARGSAAASSKVAKMQALGAKREHQATRSGGDVDAGDWDEGDEGEGDVEYEDFGMTRAERRSARGGSGHSAAAAHEDEDEEQGEDWSGPAAAPESFESIRLPRQRLEMWQLEPFFDETVVGCLVRIGLGQTETGGSGLYRLAEVVAVAEDAEKPYSLGSRRCTKRLQLEFGECRRFYPMTSVSNQHFDSLECVSFQQVREAAGLPPITQMQVEAKKLALHQASHYQYSEEDVARKVRQEQQSKPVQELTTRQKLLARHSGGGGQQTQGPRKFQRNVLGQAVYSEE